MTKILNKSLINSFDLKPSIIKDEGLFIFKCKHHKFLFSSTSKKVIRKIYLELIMDYIDLVCQSLMKDLGEFNYHVEKIQSKLNSEIGNNKNIEIGKSIDSSKEILKLKNAVDKLNGLLHVY